MALSKINDKSFPNSTTTNVGWQSLNSNTGLYNSAFGWRASYSNTTGTQNVSIGRQAAQSTTTGSYNTAIGHASLLVNTTGNYLTAVGRQALYSSDATDGSTAIGYTAGINTTTGNITACGFQSLYYNTTGTNNTAMGYSALQSNTTGSYNNAIGYFSLYLNTTGGYNTAVGHQAGYHNTTGQFNVLLGHQAGYRSAGSGSIGDASVFIGYQAGYANQGNNNVGIGNGALISNTTGAFNIGVGVGAGNAITTGSKNTILGRYTGNQGLDIRTAENYIVLGDGDGNPKIIADPQGCVVIPGYGAPTFTRTQDASLNVYKSANTLRVVHFQNNYNVSGAENIRTVLGSNCNNTSSYHFIGTIEGSGDRIYIYGNGNIQNTNGSYGSFSDIKLKENIIDATPKLDDLMQVRVRNYNLKTNPEHKQIGVIAQELEEIFPGLIDETIDRDENGNELKTTTKGVKYSIFVPILIKAIQELNIKVEAQAAEIVALKGN